MSILIKGMEMPKHAAVDGEKDTVYKCAVLAHPDNTVELVIDEIFVTPYYNGHDIQHYPLTEIPTPHYKYTAEERFRGAVQELIDIAKASETPSKILRATSESLAHFACELSKLEETKQTLKECKNNAN